MTDFGQMTHASMSVCPLLPLSPLLSIKKLRVTLQSAMAMRDAGEDDPARKSRALRFDDEIIDHQPPFSASAVPRGLRCLQFADKKSPPRRCKPRRHGLIGRWSRTALSFRRNESNGKAFAEMSVWKQTVENLGTRERISWSTRTYWKVSSPNEGDVTRAGPQRELHARVADVATPAMSCACSPQGCCVAKTHVTCFQSICFQAFVGRVIGR
jgi:hypothetical protein